MVKELIEIPPPKMKHTVNAIAVWRSTKVSAPNQILICRQRDTGSREPIATINKPIKPGPRATHNVWISSFVIHGEFRSGALGQEIDKSEVSIGFLDVRGDFGGGVKMSCASKNLFPTNDDSSTVRFG